jgi:hypothetical protein
MKVDIPSNLTYNNNRMKVHIIIDADGDIYCAAASYDKASEIMSADIESGDLMEGAYITNTRM